MTHHTFTLFLLHEHPTSIKTTIEFIDELLTHGDCLSEVWDKHLTFSPRGQSVRCSNNVLNLKQIVSPADSRCTISNLTCRPLNLTVTKRLNSLGLISAGPLNVRALSRKCPQIVVLATWFKWSYLNMRWTLVRIASSNSDTRLVVRNMIPLQYSSLRRNTETSPLRTKSWDERRSRNTSASSKRRIAPQRLKLRRRGCAPFALSDQLGHC